MYNLMMLIDLLQTCVFTGDATPKRRTSRRRRCPSVHLHQSYSCIFLSKRLKMSSNLLLGLVAPLF